MILVAVPQGDIGEFAPKIFSCPPNCPQNNFKCVKISPKFDNFSIFRQISVGLTHFLHFCSLQIFIALPPPPPPQKKLMLVPPLYDQQPPFILVFVFLSLNFFDQNTPFLTAWTKKSPAWWWMLHEIYSGCHILEQLNNVVQFSFGCSAY